MLGLAISFNIYAQEFDFRGAILGMTLDEFKALPSINGKSFRDGKSVACTENKEISNVLEQEMIHLIKCMASQQQIIYFIII